MENLSSCGGGKGMTETEAQIGEAAVERKRCLDKMSCYEDRLKTVQQALSMFLDPQKNLLHKDNQRLLELASDPRADARGYVEAKTRADELTNFLRTHNAI